MKIFISADMEGISGVATGQQLKTDVEYQRFRKLMTDDVNAAIEGACNGGAKEIVVADGHGNMSNIIIEHLDSRAVLISGSNRKMLQVEGLDHTFDGIMFVGHHGREGGSEKAVINHTYASICVNELKVNDEVIGETELNSYVAAHFNVPTLFVSGDESYVKDIKQLYPNIETAVTKRGTDRYAAHLLPPKIAQNAIRENAEKAVKRTSEFKPVKRTGPYTFEMEFKGTQQATMVSTISTVEQIEPKRVRFTCDDIVTAYQQMWACIIIAIKATDGVLGHFNA